jgi:beta-lactamase regulating signal transducer with metallopeptidase domain
MTYHMESLGWTLVHFCWQAAAIALVYRVVELALVDRRSQLRYALSLGALLSMLVVAVATLGYEESRDRDAASAVIPVSEAAPSAMVPSAAKLSAGVEVTAGVTPRSSQIEPRAMLPYLDMIWLAGVVVLSFRFAGGWWMLRRLRRAAVAEVPAPVLASMERMRHSIGIKRAIMLRISNDIAGPIALGAFRALVLLPFSALTALNAEELEVVLAHELAHIRRADYLWNMLQMVIETLFFFHPAVWWIGRCVREQRELCCDDIALQVCASPVVYATALLRLEEQRSSRLQMAMALDGSSKVGLRARIARILGDTNTPPPRQDLAPLSLVGLAAALVLFLLPMPQMFASLYPRAYSLHALVSPHTPLTAEPTEGSKQEGRSTQVDTSVVTNTLVKVAVASQVAAVSPSPVTVAEIAAAVDDLAVTAQEAVTESSAPQQAAPVADGKQGKSDYIDAMKAAGYNVDLDEYVGMKVQGITPEYAREMAKLGLGKPSAGELIGLKIQGVTPEYARQMTDLGYGKPSLDDLMGMKIQGVSAEYAKAMSQMDLGKPTLGDLVGMKIHGVTPEYVKGLREAGIKPANFSDAMACKIQQVTPEYARGMEAAGYGQITTDTLVGLRIQGVTPEYAKSIKAQFPDATLDNLMQLRIFHIDDAFIASAKRHGFSPITIDKLVKLHMSGLIEGVDDTRN